MADTISESTTSTGSDVIDENLNERILFIKKIKLIEKIKDGTVCFC